MVPGLWIKPGIMPTLASPGVITPGQLGPIKRQSLSDKYDLTCTISCTGIPSVIHTISLIPASAASIIASAANGGGTKIIDTSVGTTKIVYAVEDAFDKLPVHWMWWPAIGGLAVGIIGYFAPSTMGVGYDNIRGILSGNLTVHILLVFCFLKFISWAISLGSGTSGGTLAPLFTIGGAMGALMALGIQAMFPALSISLPAAALIGMAAMFSGASRAFLTSVIFALETTQEPHMLLPLLGGCAAAYFVSFVMMKSTIMTEKIARRGIHAPESYVPDILNSYKVGDVLKEEVNVMSTDNTIGDARKFILDNDEKRAFTSFAIIDEGGDLYGVISMKDIFDLEILPIINRAKTNQVAGILSHRDILEAYELRDNESGKEERTIFIKKKSIRIIIKGRRLMGR